MDANVAKTREYYRTIPTSSLCDCAYCRSYRLQVKSAFPEVAEYLESIGVDMEKPFETSPLEPDENGLLEYCGCQYIVLGHCRHCRPEYHHSIGGVELRVASSHPRTSIEQEHFVLELFPIQLRYVQEPKI